MEDFGHTPVMVDEVLGLLGPASRLVIVDCTAGLGGHSDALLRAASERARAVLIDLDEANLRRARRRLEGFGTRVRYFQANFGDVRDVLVEADVSHADCLLADLGVASSQLDDPERGLSFQASGPLDMRLDRSQGLTAATIVNTYGERELADLIYAYGEERLSRRIARAIVYEREKNSIETTGCLADIVLSAVPAMARKSRVGVHPATRTFQALRIAVNREMDNLERLLAALPDVLAVGGRAAIISFHSLEDRMVKQAFAKWESTGLARLLTKKPLQASETESRDNPRSRSAKLRGIEKTQG
ncbi:MAG: 16S rRNA (cytosine(1402)-N(4))-methyltransferase RsmH [Phycisphaerae bacterium]|nr:16S rRNA (cytosine(1402)-N(4))-methyltransferase RsmH [Phycisphaerae bacterium]